MDNKDKMIIRVDIDDTICKSPKGEDPDYSQCKPIKKNIRKINKLYDNGNYIIYWTSRGMGTKKDWMQVTMAQFEKWGVKYNQLQLNKPVYDMIVCDKAKRIEEL